MHTSKPTESTYGSWSSAITSDLIISDSLSIDEPILHNNSIYYIERRPNEGGRCVIVKADNDQTVDVLPAAYSTRSRVHEYGGGSYCIAQRQIFFINDGDQDIYRIHEQKISRITNLPHSRFADFSIDTKRQCIIAVCETHNGNNTVNSIVSIDIVNGKITTLIEGDDFYASPRLDTHAQQLCWQSWNHPNMPWDGNQLWLADVDTAGAIKNKKHIAGSENIAVFQPQWSPDNTLYFIADDSGWWHLYRYLGTEANTKTTSQSIQLTDGEKEFGLPQWVFAQSSYAFINATKIICSYQCKGKTILASLSLDKSNKIKEINTPWSYFSSIRIEGNKLCFIAASSTEFPQLISTTFDDENTPLFNIIKKSCELPLSNEHFSTVTNITFTNRHQQDVFACYYPPTNPAYDLNKQSAAPPLIVICHGGPTGQSNTALDPKKQFWTSRGFALLDVNYSGSTGYGKQYRNRLTKKWGELDVEDCCDAALHMVKQGLANKDQLIIRGSSAGGYTVLSAITFHHVFSAGASYYGISELSTLACDTHKFEAHYLDMLVGPYPEDALLYQSRSPIYSTEKLHCPVIFFQGIEDKVVPKEQAEKMFDALDKKGLPVAAQYYVGEQHGFRKAESIKQSLENELSFYQLIFNLKPADEIKFIGNIQINNI